MSFFVDDDRTVLTAYAPGEIYQLLDPSEVKRPIIMGAGNVTQSVQVPLTASHRANLIFRQVGCKMHQRPHHLAPGDSRAE